MKPILAVVVLYNMAFEESPALKGLTACFHALPQTASSIDLLVADNSSAPQQQSSLSFAAEYLHDGSNAGLARRYNQALQKAIACGATWLLLLDQDTAVTAEYVTEAIALSTRLTHDMQVIAIAPKLVTGDRLQSPHKPLFRHSGFSFSRSTEGLAEGLLRVYNSGVVLRVSALEAMGGFPESYWLDYLDHATFHRLQNDGGRVYVMRSALEHAMSIDREDKHRDPAYAARHLNQLATELRFYREYGSARERLAHRLHLLRLTFQALTKRHWREAQRLVGAACSVRASQGAAYRSTPGRISVPQIKQCHEILPQRAEEKASGEKRDDA